MQAATLSRGMKLDAAHAPSAESFDGFDDNDAGGTTKDVAEGYGRFDAHHRTLH